MCGIFSILGSSPHSSCELENASNNGAKRGPEFSVLNQYSRDGNMINVNNPDIVIESAFTLGFHRLAINGLDDISHQPIMLNGCLLICNGEIYNYKELYEENNITPTTNSDCEVILHLYEKYGFENTLSLLDGVFAIVLVDTRSAKAFVSRDPYGVRPMFMMTPQKNNTAEKNSLDGFFAFASEMKQLVPIAKDDDSIEQFPPGNFAVYDILLRTHVKEESMSRYSYFPYMRRMEDYPYPSEYTIYKYLGQINMRLNMAVKKRVDNTDRPIACLLSGGLDSSLITALVSKYVSDKSKLETYSIGFEGSEDLMYAEKVAMHLGTKHTSIIVSEQDFLDAIPEVIYAIESYDTTTVRASVGNFMVAKYISEHSKAKVIFNGDGSDELTGGYLYFHKCPNSTEFDLETRRLLNNIHYFDVLRSDRCIAYHGLEARTPFLDRSFVEHYLTFSKNIRNHNMDNKCEKYLLRYSFDVEKIIPDEILWRTKEAFSDGVSSKRKAWYETIQEYVNGNIEMSDYTDMSFSSQMVNPPETLEQKYYRNIFEKHFSGRGKVIPYFWMPKYTNAKDSSARTLDFYNSLVKK
jgi:asparagine synthase (glutamine-hydrolysing)